MAPEKAPAFQFYPKDFLSDGNQGEMTLAEVGAYARLMCRCWLEKTIPDDWARAANLCGATRPEMRKLWPAIRRCFQPHPTEAGRLIHPRLEKEREKQETYRRRQSDKGKASAAARQPQGQPDGNHGSTGRQPEGNSPISDLRSPDSSQPVQRLPSKPPDDVTTELAERAGRFVERYAELYAEHRHGARLLRRQPALDWDRACKLCRVWDDGRLEKLAIVFLKSDDDWIAKTDRGLAVFESRATWCDERLSAWEAEQRRKASAS